MKHIGFTVIAVVLACLNVRVGQSAELREPLTLTSENGVLDLLMIAKASPLTTLPGAPTGWVYEICKRPAVGVNACPQSDVAPNYYGGTLLQLRTGDKLKIHLVNQLPPVTDSKHAVEPGQEFLALNPTNIHTHGMLVSPRFPSAANPTFGDNVFVLTFNSANGKPQPSPHIHSAIRYDWTDYEISVPSNHPSGLYWFHPHAHGVSLNQISAGLSGIITVGDISDYLCKNRDCQDFARNATVRQLILKDAQILPAGNLKDQEDPMFCAPAASVGDSPRLGSCAGQDLTASGGGDYNGGHWFFSLNGQVYPTVPVKSPAGEIWRLTNTSGSATYDLHLWNPQQNRDMLFQVISIDGVSIAPSGNPSPKNMAEIAGGKFVPESCPANTPDSHAAQPVCTRTLHMMPSSRAEVWVAYRDASDHVIQATTPSYAVFRTNGYQTGPSGDSWPAVDLARVEFAASAAAGTSIPAALGLDGEANRMSAPAALAAEMSQADQAQSTAGNTCHPLPPGHMRRIFYAVPTTNLNGFGLASEEIDEHGNVVGTPVTDVTPFDPMAAPLCVALGPGGTPAVERWQLVNVATEDHNFHIHQVKFRVLSKDELAGSAVPKGIMLDNVPLPHAAGTCGNNPPGDSSNPIADWRAGLCQADPVTVEIPFAIPGDFVYHCHILEHEDGGMMAKIQVRVQK